MGVQLRHNNKLLVYPRQGTVLVVSDLHGNYDDFLAVCELFERNCQESSEKVYLLFLGDLVHGPYLREQEWSPRLGDFYFDRSPELLAGLFELQKKYPHQIHCLLGNHEHSHIGGPVTSKFHRNEALALEERLNPSLKSRFFEWLKGLPLLALAPCGVLFTHGAPRTSLRKLSDLERISYDGYEHIRPGLAAYAPIVGELLWAREAKEEEAGRLLQVFSRYAPLHVVVHGHDIAESGYERRNRRVFLLSTSFGVPRERKVVLRLSLSGLYRTTEDFREGVEIVPLYP